MVISLETKTERGKIHQGGRKLQKREGKICKGGREISVKQGVKKQCKSEAEMYYKGKRKSIVKEKEKGGKKEKRE